MHIANDNAHKKMRGGQGSAEDELTTAKKSSIATNDSPNTEETICTINEQEEPSLLEIKQLSVGIQIWIASVLTENMALRKEIEEIKDSAYMRKNSLEKQGIPQDAHTDTETAVIKVAVALKITLEPEDIEISHKLKWNKAIIVKFCKTLQGTL